MELHTFQATVTTDILKVSVAYILQGPSPCATLLKVAQQ